MCFTVVCCFTDVLCIVLRMCVVSLMWCVAWSQGSKCHGTPGVSVWFAHCLQPTTTCHAQRQCSQQHLPPCSSKGQWHHDITDYLPWSHTVVSHAFFILSKALNKYSITHIMYIETEMLPAIKMYIRKRKKANT